MADDDQIQVSNPQGQPGTIPRGQWEDALDAGYQLHSHVVMYDPSGKRGIVPKEQAGQARDAGYSIMAPKPEEPGRGFWAHAGRGLANVVGGLANTPFSPSEMVSAMPKQALQIGAEDAMRRAEGRSRAYRLAAPLAQMAVPGLNPRGMEEAANVGDTAGVLGETVAPTALAAAPLGVHVANRALEGPRINAYKSAVRSLAGKTPADLGFTQTITRAAPDVAQVARETDFSQKGNARVGEFHDMLNRRADEIWREEHTPQITAQAQDPINWQDVRRMAQDAITPELKANNPAAARAAQRWIDSALNNTHIGTVDGADRMLRVINAEIPNLPEPFKNIGKIVRNAAQKGIRGELETALTGAGQEGVQKPNTRWGALREIADAVGERLNVSANEPFSLWKSFIYPGLKLGYGGGFLGGALGHELGAGDPMAMGIGAGLGAATGMGTAIGHEILAQPGSRISRAMRGLGRTRLAPDVTQINPPGAPALGGPRPVAGGPAIPPTGGGAQPPGAPAPTALAGPSAAPGPVNAGLPTTAAHGPLFAGQPAPPTLGQPMAPPIEMRETAPNIFESAAGEEPEHERLIRLGETARETPGPTKEEIEGAQERAEREAAEQRINEQGIVGKSKAQRREAAETPKAEEPAKEEPPEEPAEEVHIKGLTAKERKVAATEKAKPVEKEFSKQEIEEAELLIQQEVGMMQAGERPGHYFSENEMGAPNPQRAQRGEGTTYAGHWYGVKSMRGMLPWMREHNWSPSQLEKALRNKDSAMYQKAVRSAIDFIEKEKAASAAQEEEERAAIQGEEPLEPPPEETPEGVLPGFGQAVAEQARGAAQVRGEGLQQEMGTPRNIEEAAGRMERESPLFRYTEANPQNEMFPPVGKKRRLPE